MQEVAPSVLAQRWSARDGALIRLASSTDKPDAMVGIGDELSEIEEDELVESSSSEDSAEDESDEDDDDEILEGKRERREARRVRTAQRLEAQTRNADRRRRRAAHEEILRGRAAEQKKRQRLLAGAATKTLGGQFVVSDLDMERSCLDRSQYDPLELALLQQQRAALGAVPPRTLQPLIGDVGLVVGICGPYVEVSWPRIMMYSIERYVDVMPIMNFEAEGLMRTSDDQETSRAIVQDVPFAVGEQEWIREYRDVQAEQGDQSDTGRPPKPASLDTQGGPDVDVAGIRIVEEHVWYDVNGEEVPEPQPEVAAAEAEGEGAADGEAGVSAALADGEADEEAEGEKAGDGEAAGEGAGVDEEEENEEDGDIDDDGPSSGSGDVSEVE